MKKTVFFVVLLLTVPAFARVDLVVKDVWADEVVIGYAADGNIPRGFGLNVTVDNGAIIQQVIPAHEGDCDAVNKGYGIFMGTINLDDTENPVWNTPVAPNDDPCALGGLGTSGVTLEMGSLYTGANSPPSTGDLFTLILDGDFNDCNLAIVENARRGGVVMENPDEDADANLPLAAKVPDFWKYRGPAVEYTQWDLVGKPESWTQLRQCHGDADGQTETYTNPRNVNWQVWVYMDDLQHLINGWHSTYPAVDGSGHAVETRVRADFDHYAQTYTNPRGVNFQVRVYMDDLDVMIAYWHSTVAGKPNPDCQTATPASP